jgi:hypothetical protein
VTANLAQRMLEVNKALGWVEKRGENKQQNYDFVRAVDVFADARKALAANGVLWSFSTRDYTISEIGGKVWHQMVGDYAFINVDKPDEDVIAGTVVGSASPPGDKGAWVVTTGMLKYALIQALLLPTGDDPETDGEAPTVKSSSPTAPPAVKVEKQKAVAADSTGLNDKQKAKLKITMREHGLAVVESQRYVLNKLVGKHSSLQMTNEDLDKVLAFFAEKTDENQALVVEAMAHGAAA